MTYPRELTAAEIAAMIAGTSFSVVAVNNPLRVGLLVVFGEGCTAGEVALKSAPSQDFAGGWAEQISCPCPTTPPGADGEAVTAATEIVGMFVRPEIKTALADGTVTRVVIYVS